MEWLRVFSIVLGYWCTFSQFFQVKYYKFICLVPNKVFNVYNTHGLKLLTSLHLRLSHLGFHKFKYSFNNCLGEICMCGKDIKFTNHFLSQYSFDKSLWVKFVMLTVHLLTKLKTFCYTLLFGKDYMNSNKRFYILNTIRKYILLTERSHISLYE